jgi:Tfp pilus assembly protein PilF
VALGRVAERQGDFPRAMATYRAALERDRSRADACLRLAVLHDSQGKFTESAGWYRRALELAPGDPDVFCDMGYSLYLQRRWAEAEMNLKQALAVNPDHARARNNLGLVLAHDGRANEALDQFLRAGNTRAEAHNNLAFALSVEGRWAEARRQYELALAADPASPVARDRLRELDAVVAKAAPRRPTAQDDRLVRASATATAAGASAGSRTPPGQPVPPGIATATAGPQKNP